MCDGTLEPLADPYGHRKSDGMTRRTALDLLARGGLATLLASKGMPSAHAQNDGTVRIGYLPITDATPLLVAYAKGYFADEGLDAPRPTLIRSWPSLVETFASHEFNLVHLLKPIPVWMRYNNRIPVKVVAWCHTNGSALVVGGMSGIESFADCSRRQIAVPFWYSMHNIVLQIALRNAGLKAVIKPQGELLANNEVNLQVLPPPEMPAALAAGKIDAYIVAEPFNALGELKAGGRVLRFTGDIWKNHPCCVVTMHEEDLQRSEWSQRILNAIVRASLYAAANKAEVAELLSRDGEGLLPVPKEVVVRAMTYYDVDEYRQSGAVRNIDEWGNGRIDFDPYPYPSATRLIVESMRDTVGGSDSNFLQDLDPEFVARDMVDDRFVRNALQDNPEWSTQFHKDPADDPFVRKEIFAL